MRHEHYFRRVVIILFAYVAVIAMLLVTIHGPFYNHKDFSSAYLDNDQVTQLRALSQKEKPVQYLFLYDSKDKESMNAVDQLEFILSDMRSGYESRDVQTISESPDYAGYQGVLIGATLLKDFDPLYEGLKEYAQNGGSLLFWLPPFTYDSANDWNELLGIEGEEKTGKLDSFLPEESFMFGGEEGFWLPQEIADSVMAELDGDVSAYASSKDGKNPVIWSGSCGEGKVTVCNFPAATKNYRGIFASTLSLTQDTFVWPVINASTYFLDDFPAPLGSRAMVTVRSGVQVTYTQFVPEVWFPAVMRFSDKYDIPFTGMIIESYSNQVSGDLPRTAPGMAYSYFGKTLLNHGGELGIHGYNHQPLHTVDEPYEKDLGYRLWESETEMSDAMQEVTAFAKETYPDSSFDVYVPASNILSETARQMIGENGYGIRSIASVFLSGPDAYSQEFSIAQDGIVETPRIIAGETFDDAVLAVAFSELNYHYVNTHFMHPDDALDSARSDGLSWSEMEKNLDAYMGWVQKSAPGIRHCSGSALAGAVQRYALADPQITQDKNTVTIVNPAHVDKEYMMMRINSGMHVKMVDGGSAEQINDTLYLIECAQETVTVHLEEGN